MTPYGSPNLTRPSTHNTPRRRRIAAVGATLAVTVAGVAMGCSVGGDDATQVPMGEAVATAPQAIKGGYIDELSKAVVGVVRFSFQHGFAACTGTLIAPNVVLTAHHCVAPTQSDGEGVRCGETTFGAPYDADQMYITTKTSFTQNPTDYHQAREIVLPPGQNEFCGRDQAIIILAEPVDASEAVPMVPRVDSVFETGEQYYAVGYGQQGESGGSGTRYRRDNLVSTCVANECPSLFVKVTEWQGEDGICQGDSGGPAIDLQDRVVGVASRGAFNCGLPVYGYVYGWADWIKETTIYAMSQDGLDAPPWATGFPTDPVYSAPVGAGCSAPDQCISNACFEGYCTRPCTEEAICPSGYACGENGFCLADAIDDEVGVTEEGDDGSKVVRTTVTSCAAGTVGASGSDPTNPLPWATLVGAMAALALLRRRTS